MAEQLLNGVSTTLNGAINNSVTTFVITTTTGFPTSGDYRVKVDAEIMKVTGRSSSTLTVVRGVDGTTAVSHLTGATISIVLSAAGLIAAIGNFNMAGTFASRPAAGVLGRRYKATDSPYEYYDNGTTWDAFFMGFPVKPPQTTDFTWLNQGGATVDGTKDGIVMTVPGNSGDSARMQVLNVPSTPYVIDLGMVMNFAPGQYYAADGLVLVETGATKLKLFCLLSESSNLRFSVDYWTGYSTYNSGQYRATAYNNGNLFFLRIADDGTNRTFWYSLDGQNWIQVYTEAHNTQVTPDKIGILSDAQQTLTGHPTWFVHWYVH